MSASDCPPADESSRIPASRKVRRRELWHLGFVFGAIYFVQGIGEPTEGLIAQPVRALLKSWSYPTEQIASFVAILALPWSLKPLYGLMADFIPLPGTRRRSYLILTTSVTAISLGYLYVAPLSAGSYQLLLLLLLIPTIGVAFSDVVADALMIEKGQPLALTGRLQSIQWSAMYGATIMTGSLGGYLTQHGYDRAGFLICAIATLGTLLLALFWIQEPHVERRQTWSEVGRELWGVARIPELGWVACFLFLWNFNPFSTAVLYMYMTERMQWSEQFYGHTVSILSLASVLACMLYGTYCRRIPFPMLLHLSILFGVAATLAYWLMVDEHSAVIVSFLVGFVYMTATLIQLDLAARSCPPHAAGTTFATLMALSNLSVSLSTWVGGQGFAILEEWWGSTRAFQTLVGIGALFTALCWFLLPKLRRYPPNLGDNEPATPIPTGDH